MDPGFVERIAASMLWPRPNFTVADQENGTCRGKIFCEVRGEGTWQREVSRGRTVSSFWSVGNEALVLSEIFLGQ
jgi:hypothetical protein